MKKGIPSPKDRINAALDIAECYGNVDGSHHKMWCIDQMVRALLGCPDRDQTETRDDGVEYTFTYQGENKAYEQWVANVTEGNDGPDTYEWDVGIPP